MGAGRHIFVRDGSEWQDIILENLIRDVFRDQICSLSNKVVRFMPYEKGIAPKVTVG